MSSLEYPARIKQTRQILKAVGFVFVIAPLLLSGLSACAFKPLYGSTSSGGSLNEALKSVEIAPISGRVGQRLRNELIFKTTGGGAMNKTEYRLEIAVRESVSSILVRTSGDSKGQIYVLDTNFQLVRTKDGKVVFKGKNRSRAAFDKFDSIFATTRARIDAENRTARTIADSIRTRVATYLSKTV